MNVQDVGSLSLGQWMAILRGWNKAHGDNTPQPPTREEFEAAVLGSSMR